jgi:hypothetical protein
MVLREDMDEPCPRCGGLFPHERIIDRLEGCTYWQRRCVNCGCVKVSHIEQTHVERPLDEPVAPQEGDVPKKRAGRPRKNQPDDPALKLDISVALRRLHRRLKQEA